MLVFLGYTFISGAIIIITTCSDESLEANCLRASVFLGVRVLPVL